MFYLEKFSVLIRNKHGQNFLQELWCSPVSITPPMLHPHSHNYICSFPLFHLTLNCPFRNIKSTFHCISVGLMDRINHYINTYLRNHISVIVITERPAQFFIVHGWFVFTFTPQLCNHFWIVQFELPFTSKPMDNVAMLLVRQQLKEELPQLNLTIVPYHKQYAVNVCQTSYKGTTSAHCDQFPRRRKQKHFQIMKIPPKCPSNFKMVQYHIILNPINKVSFLI